MPGGREGEETELTREYRCLPPRRELTPWLASLWVQQSPAIEAPPTTVLPNGQVELIVRYGDPFVHFEGGEVVTVPPVAALGQRTRPIVAAATGVTGLVIARLHSWASDALFGEEVGAFTDQTVDLADVIGRPRVASLGDRVAAATRSEDRARTVEAFLEGLLRRHEPDALAAACARQVSQRWGNVSVDRLAEELGVSGRHLRRRFTRAVGIGPKRLSRLVRAQRAVGGLRDGCPWPEVALRCGYVDQAHLTRELRAFTGRTPGALQRSSPETPLERSFNRPGLSPFFTTAYL